MPVVDQQLAHRVRLPADDRSPMLARRMLRTALHNAGLDDLIDDAVLLTSELCENAVLHAGTDYELLIELSESELTVTVLDHGLTALELHRATPRSPTDRAATHGRGLLLVESIATAWGTRHDASGHQVWFILRHGPAEPAAEVASPSSRAGEPADWPMPSASRWLLHLDDARVAEIALVPLVSELVRRLCDVLSADGAGVWVDYGDGAGEQELATVGRPADADSTTLPLPLPAPLAGRLGVRVPQPSPSTVEIAQLTAQRVALAVESDWIRALGQRRWSWMIYLVEAGELLAHSLDVELAAALVPQLIVPRLGRWCGVHLLDEQGQLTLTAVNHLDETALPGLRAALDASRPQLYSLLHSGADTVSTTSPDEGIAVPLVARGHPLGTLAVGRPAGRPHNSEEIMVISDVARRAAPAIDNAQRHAAQVATSQALQQALLPRTLPASEGIEFAAAYLPASNNMNVGGDFYDVVEMKDGCWLVSIGDVCGKGAVAAARTGLVRDVLRVLVRQGRPPAQVLELLNEMMLEAQDPTQFATVVLAVISRQPAAHQGLAVELVLAGHEQPVLVGADTAALVGQHGTAAGLINEFAVHPTRHLLSPGEALVIYTDGVTERRRGSEEFGQARLLAALASVGDSSAAAIVTGLRRALEQFSAEPQEDDIAVIVVRAPA
ncbi:MAG: SpoIIE family protein phosphatase [Pseudonocardiaceae bacterium]